MAADVFVADRSVQIAKLKTDLQVATSNAELTGVPLQDIVLALLQRSEEQLQREQRPGRCAFASHQRWGPS